MARKRFITYDQKLAKARKEASSLEVPFLRSWGLEAVQLRIDATKFRGTRANGNIANMLQPQPCVSALSQVPSPVADLRTQRPASTTAAGSSRGEKAAKLDYDPNDNEESDDESTESDVTDDDHSANRRVRMLTVHQRMFVLTSTHRNLLTQPNLGLPREPLPPGTSRWDGSPLAGSRMKSQATSMSTQMSRKLSHMRTLSLLAIVLPCSSVRLSSAQDRSVQRLTSRRRVRRV